MSGCQSKARHFDEFTLDSLKNILYAHGSPPAVSSIPDVAGTEGKSNSRTALFFEGGSIELIR